MSADPTAPWMGTSQEAASVLDAMDARIVDLGRAAAAGGVELGDDHAPDAPDHVRRVPGSPEPPD
jgi:hypothetical protein